MHTAGLAALTLGACVMFNDGGGDLDGAAVVDVVVERAGLYGVFCAVDRLAAHPAFAAAAAAPPPVPPPPPRADGDRTTPTTTTTTTTTPAVGLEAALVAALYPHDFARWAGAFMGEAQRAMVTLYARPKQVRSRRILRIRCKRRASGR